MSMDKKNTQGIEDIQFADEIFIGRIKKALLNKLNLFVKNSLNSKNLDNELGVFTLANIRQLLKMPVAGGYIINPLQIKKEQQQGITPEDYSRYKANQLVPFFVSNKEKESIAGAKGDQKLYVIFFVPAVGVEISNKNFENHKKLFDSAKKKYEKINDIPYLKVKEAEFSKILDGFINGNFSIGKQVSSVQGSRRSNADNELPKQDNSANDNIQDSYNIINKYKQKNRNFIDMNNFHKNSLTSLLFENEESKEKDSSKDKVDTENSSDEKKSSDDKSFSIDALGKQKAKLVTKQANVVMTQFDTTDKNLVAIVNKLATKNIHPVIPVKTFASRKSVLPTLPFIVKEKGTNNIIGVEKNGEEQIEVLFIPIPDVEVRSQDKKFFKEFFSVEIDDPNRIKSTPKDVTGFVTIFLPVEKDIETSLESLGKLVLNPSESNKTRLLKLKTKSAQGTLSSTTKDEKSKKQNENLFIGKLSNLLLEDASDESALNAPSEVGGYSLEPVDLPTAEQPSGSNTGTPNEDKKSEDEKKAQAEKNITVLWTSISKSIKVLLFEESNINFNNLLDSVAESNKLLEQIKGVKSSDFNIKKEIVVKLKQNTEQYVFDTGKKNKNFLFAGLIFTSDDDFNNVTVERKLLFNDKKIDIKYLKSINDSENSDIHQQDFSKELSKEGNELNESEEYYCFFPVEGEHKKTFIENIKSLPEKTRKDVVLKRKSLAAFSADIHKGFFGRVMSRFSSSDEERALTTQIKGLDEKIKQLDDTINKIESGEVSKLFDKYKDLDTEMFKSLSHEDSHNIISGSLSSEEIEQLTGIKDPYASHVISYKTYISIQKKSADKTLNLFKDKYYSNIYYKTIKSTEVISALRESGLSVSENVDFSDIEIIKNLDKIKKTVSDINKSFLAGYFYYKNGKPDDNSNKDRLDKIKELLDFIDKIDEKQNNLFKEVDDSIRNISENDVNKAGDKVVSTIAQKYNSFKESFNSDSTADSFSIVDMLNKKISEHRNYILDIIQKELNSGRKSFIDQLQRLKRSEDPKYRYEVRKVKAKILGNVIKTFKNKVKQKDLSRVFKSILLNSRSDDVLYRVLTNVESFIDLFEGKLVYKRGLGLLLENDFDEEPGNKIVIDIMTMLSSLNDAILQDEDVLSEAVNGLVSRVKTNRMYKEGNVQSYFKCLKVEVGISRSRFDDASSEAEDNLADIIRYDLAKVLAYEICSEVFEIREDIKDKKKVEIIGSLNKLDNIKLYSGNILYSEATYNKLQQELKKKSKFLGLGKKDIDAMSRASLNKALDASVREGIKSLCIAQHKAYDKELNAEVQRKLKKKQNKEDNLEKVDSVKTGKKGLKIGAIVGVTSAVAFTALTGGFAAPVAAAAAAMGVGTSAGGVAAALGGAAVTAAKAAGISAVGGGLAGLAGPGVLKRRSEKEEDADVYGKMKAVNKSADDLFNIVSSLAADIKDVQLENALKTNSIKDSFILLESILNEGQNSSISYDDIEQKLSSASILSFGFPDAPKEAQSKLVDQVAGIFEDVFDIKVEGVANAKKAYEEARVAALIDATAKVGQPASKAIAQSVSGSGLPSNMNSKITAAQLVSLLNQSGGNVMQAFLLLLLNPEFSNNLASEIDKGTNVKKVEEVLDKNGVTTNLTQNLSSERAELPYINESDVKKLHKNLGNINNVLSEIIDKTKSDDLLLLNNEESKTNAVPDDININYDDFKEKIKSEFNIDDNNKASDIKDIIADPNKGFKLIKVLNKEVFKISLLISFEILHDSFNPVYYCIKNVLIGGDSIVESEYMPSNRIVPFPTETTGDDKTVDDNVYNEIKEKLKSVVDIIKGMDVINESVIRKSVLKHGEYILGSLVENLYGFKNEGNKSCSNSLGLVKEEVEIYKELYKMWKE